MEPAAVPAASPVGAQRPWPAGLPEQIKLVAEVLAAVQQPLTPAELEARFARTRGRWRECLATILDTLEALGRARRSAGVAGETRWAAA